MAADPADKRRRTRPVEPYAYTTLINLEEVCLRTGVGRTSIQKLVREGKFPPRLRYAGLRTTRWSAQAVEQWIQDQIAASTARRKKGDPC